MANISYCRVSTGSLAEKQDYERQRFMFESTKINFDYTFEEHVSGGVRGDKRIEFNKMLEVLQEGDTVWFTEQSRLGRSYIDTFDMIDKLLFEKKVNIRFISDGTYLQKGTKFNPDEWLKLAIKCVVDEYTKRNIGYQTSVKLQALKSQGKQLGRNSGLTKEQRDEIRKLKEQGMKQVEIAKKFNTTTSTVSRIINGILD